MSKHCIHCNGIIENEELSYCESCYNKLKTKGMFSENKKYFCRICGKPLSHKNKEMLCNKHLNEYREFGICISNNQHDSNEANEIIKHENYAEIVLYDDLTTEETGETILIDIEDIDLVKDKIWKRCGKYIVGQDEHYTYDLPNLLTNSDNKIEYLNGDILDNRKENLNIIEKKKFKHHFANNKKFKNKIIITSIGGSTEDVTGSCIAVEYPLDNGNRNLILLESGGIQTNNMVEDYNNNKKMIDNIPFNLASHIFIAHCHADHIANIPAGISRGFQGDIVTTYENSEIIRPMLLDSAFIHQRNVISMNNKGKKYELLYDESDTYKAIDRIKVVERNKTHKIDSNLSVQFIDNNHCCGSTSIILYIKKPSGRVVKLLYSSDLGSSNNQLSKPYSFNRKQVSKCNIAILESTYGDRSDGFTKKEHKQEIFNLLAKIREVVYNGNRVLIPCFSYDRSQSIMDLLYHIFKDEREFKNVKVIVDSRLTNEINKVYENILEGDLLERWKRVLSWENFIFVDNYKKTQVLAKQKEPCVIISSSGMFCGGHSVEYLKEIAGKSKDCIIFVGYSSPATLAGKIQQGAKSVTIENKRVNIRCETIICKTFSGHIQQDELINYMKGLNCQKILIHHGSEDAKEQLKFKAEEEFLFSDMSKKVTIINKKNNVFVI